MFEAAILCLTLNLYHEVRGEHSSHVFEAHEAVAQVTVERAGFDIGRVCDVVLAPKQFSWANGLSRVERKKYAADPSGLVPVGLVGADAEAWRLADFFAWLTLGGKLEHPLPAGAKHYHRTDSKPIWRHGLTPYSTIGSHIFYME